MVNVKSVASLKRLKLYARLRIGAGVSLFVSTLVFGLTLRFTAHSFPVFLSTALFVAISFLLLIHFDSRYDALQDSGKRYYHGL
jgi:hypothetical protein